jgi:hypothetical protein
LITDMSVLRAIFMLVRAYRYKNSAKMDLSIVKAANFPFLANDILNKT